MSGMRLQSVLFLDFDPQSTIFFYREGRYRLYVYWVQLRKQILSI
jgi:hypothetical protein